MGKGGSSGGSDRQVVQSTTVQKADPWSGVQPYLKNLYAAADARFKQPQQYFPSQTYAPQSPLSAAGQQAALGYATNYLPGLIQSGMSGLASQLNAQDVAHNPYVQQMLAQQISGSTNAFQQNAQTLTDTLKNQWLPSIRSGAGLAGQYGGTRQGVAEGVAIGEAAKQLGNYGSSAQAALGNQIAQTQLGAYGQGLDAAKAGMLFLPQMAQLGMMPSQMYEQLGARQEGYNQQAIDDAMARFNFAQSEPYNRMGWYSGILNGAAPYASQSGSGTSTTTNPDSGGSTFGNVLGGGLTGYSLGSALGGTALGGSLASTLGFSSLGIPGMILGAALGGLFR